MSSAILDPHPTATQRDWAVDVAMALTLGVITCAPHFVLMLIGQDSSSHYGQPVLVFLTCVAMVAPLVLRRHYPLLMVWLMAGAALVQVLATAIPTFPVIVVPLAVYAVARWVSGQESRQVLWLGFLGSVLGPARWVMALGPFYAGSQILLLFAMTVCLGCVLTPYAMGRRVAEQADADAAWRRTQLERQKLALAAQEQRARMAEVNTRNEIARELHDIVAHSLSVMIVQAEGGRALAAKKPEQAVAVLDTIADTGREALQEARRIVALLRDGPDAADFGPAPTLADIPELVARTGDRVELRATGAIPTVSPAVALTVYRVVQEALTNVLKHAGPAAHAWVTIGFAPDVIDVEVRDDGAGAAVRTDGAGSGLRGMRERVGSMGGHVVAQPHPDGGFVVRAVVPTSPSAGSGRM